MKHALHRANNKTERLLRSVINYVHDMAKAKAIETSAILEAVLTSCLDNATTTAGKLAAVAEYRQRVVECLKNLIEDSLHTNMRPHSSVKLIYCDEWAVT